MAVPPGNTVLPAIRSPKNEGWDFLVRRIEDQRSELDRKERELGELQYTLATMAQTAREKDRLIARLHEGQGPAIESLQAEVDIARGHAGRFKRALREAGIPLPCISPGLT